MQFGELAADRRLTWPQPVGQIGERSGEPGPRFVQQQRRRDARKLSDARLALSRFRGEEALEEEPVGRQAGDGERGEGGDRWGASDLKERRVSQGGTGGSSRHTFMLLMASYASSMVLISMNSVVCGSRSWLTISSLPLLVRMEVRAGILREVWLQA